jgi:hypothetical protein
VKASRPSRAGFFASALDGDGQELSKGLHGAAIIVESGFRCGDLASPAESRPSIARQVDGEFDVSLGVGSEMGGKPHDLKNGRRVGQSERALPGYFRL